MKREESKQRHRFAMACRRGDLALVEEFVNNGCDPNSPIMYGEAPLCIACWNGHIDIVRYLIHRGAAVQGNTITPLWAACRNGHTMIVELLLSVGQRRVVDVQYRVSPLWLACNKNNIPLARLLLDNGANVDLVDHEGRSPLWIACKSNSTYGSAYLNLVRLLVEHGAVIDKPDKYGVTPLIAVNKDKCKWYLSRYPDMITPFLQQWKLVDGPRRNQIAVKLCIDRLQKEGMVATVQATPINELSQELFVFMVVEDMMSRKMYGLAECVVSFVGLRSGPVK
jgi:hypothetical protein